MIYLYQGLIFLNIFSAHPTTSHTWPPLIPALMTAGYPITHERWRVDRWITKSTSVSTGRKYSVVAHHSVAHRRLVNGADTRLTLLTRIRDSAVLVQYIRMYIHNVLVHNFCFHNVLFTWPSEAVITKLKISRQMLNCVCKNYLH